MERSKIDRINELARLAKERDLTEEEQAERAALRAEYMQHVRSQLRGESPKKDDNANYIKNIEKAIRYYPKGIPPYIAGIDTIG